MNIKHPKVAVVILNWNGKHFLEQFLPSVIASTYPNLDIYVADNASTDDSLSFLTEYYKNSVKTIINKDNYGFAKGYNKALKNVEADIFVLLNSDVEVSPGWIEPVVKLMQSDSDIAICQPKILSYHQKDHFEYAGAAGGWMDRFGYAFCKGRFFDICEKDEGQYDQIDEIFWAGGCSFFIKSEVYRKMGGLDAGFFAHQEEIDLCWRCKNAGYRVMYCPDSQIFHLGGGSLPKGNPRKVYLNFRNNLIMLLKNLKTYELFSTFVPRLFLDFIAVLKSLITGPRSDSWAILKAHYQFWLHFSKWWLRRKATIRLVKKIRGQRVSKKLSGLYTGSIVWDYFIRKKRSFREIMDEKV